MRVCVDIQAAVAQGAGVGRYTRGLVQHLGPQRGDDELRLFCFDFKRNGVSFSAPGATLRANRWLPGRIVQRAWRTLGAPPYNWFAGSADLYHFTNFIRAPLTRGRSVATIYDVSFLRHAEAAEPGNLRYLRRHMRKTARDADAIQTISEFSANEIHELLDVPRDRIHVAYPGLDHHAEPIAPEQADALRRKMGVDRPYLLFVGTLEPRKNLPFLFKVFDALESFDGLLLLAGMRGWKVEPILDAMQGARRAASIRHLDYVSDADLQALYAGATLFVYPSLYEGFGIPPMEAMLADTPVVSSGGGSLPEVLGDAAEIIPDFDVDAWRDRIATLLRDTARRSALVEKGRQRTALYNWPEAARRTWTLYRSLAS